DYYCLSYDSSLSAVLF
nr:immunoglobulin light chain junction region [Macaca mulatta]MOW67306.1 immunoglobulin light chain junction region [Macaca mulatta]MOW67584.1 immunoglobulin light chain junction region [Macaca mulatta]MOW69047.1 immunoglobulin light chain junction region [Macaca mulatta]MOW69258.1 immunoglobulin light chain junction region [Macaca mulatta]